MIDKKLYLILVCAMAVGQVMTMDFDEDLLTPEGASKSEGLFGGAAAEDFSKIKMVTIDFPGKEDSMDVPLDSWRGQLAHVWAHGELLKEKVSDAVHVMNENIAIYKNKAENLKNNSEDFKRMVREKIKAFDQDQYDVARLQAKIKSVFSVQREAMQKWRDASGLFYLDKGARIEASRTINRMFSEMYQYSQEILAFSKSIEAAVQLFDDAVQADIAGLAEKKAQQVAAEAEAKLEAARQAAEEEKTAQAQAALKKAERDAMKALAEYLESKAELLDKNTQKDIDEIANLSNVVKAKVAAIDMLSNQIQANRSNYSLDFVSNVKNKFAPMAATIVSDFNTIIHNANALLKEIVDIKKRYNSLKASIGENLEEQKLGKIRSDLHINFQRASALLELAQKYSKRLSELHSELQKAEGGDLITHEETIKKSKRRSLKLQATERVLELCRAVKMEQDKQKMLSERRRRIRKLRLMNDQQNNYLKEKQRALFLRHNK